MMSDRISSKPSWRWTSFAVSLSATLAALPGPLHAQPSGFTIELQTVATGLSHPVGLTHAGDGSGHLFILEQGGDVRIFEGGQLLAAPFLSIPVDCCGERGLLGLVFHPDYAGNGLFYVHYSEPGTGDTVVSGFQVSTGDPDRADAGSEQVLLTQPQPQANHNGGQMAFGPDGFLYIALGDGGGQGDPGDNGQDLGTLLGKILRIDIDAADPGLDYAIPPSNPFVGVPGAREEIWAWGLRNPWRFSFDRRTGDLLIADVGQSCFEEVSFQPAASSGGENYGWRLMEGSTCFDPADRFNCNDRPTGCNDGSLTLPILEYPHAGGDCSVTGGFRYRGSVHRAQAGVYLYADFCSGRIWGALPGCGGLWRATELLDTPLRITSFGEDESGELYVLDNGGGMHRVAVDALTPEIFAAGFETGDLSQWSSCLGVP